MISGWNSWRWKYFRICISYSSRALGIGIGWGPVRGYRKTMFDANRDVNAG